MESCEARLSFSIIGDGIHEHADPPHPRRLLRPCRERPRHCRPANQRDELASLHCLPMHADIGVQVRPSKQEKCA
jgi:hypothetical protein